MGEQLREKAMRKVVAPVIRRYLDELESIAFKEEPARSHGMSACDARLHLRLNDIADQKGLVGQQRTRLLVISQEALNEHSRSAVKAVRQALSQRPIIVVQRRRRAWLPLIIKLASRFIIAAVVFVLAFWVGLVALSH